MQLSELDYGLPPELIAQEPAAERSAARLLLVDRAHRSLGHRRVADLPELLRAGDLLVLNDARVVPARLRARRPSGGRLEILLIDPASAGPARRCVLTALVRGTPRAGERVHVADATGEWMEPLGDGRWRLALDTPEPLLGWLERVGEVPLPPYVRRPGGPTADDRERYQTVFARHPGAIAAPTAGLHFTEALLAALSSAGVRHVAITLHVGPGTFLPIRTDDLDAFTMAPERYEISAAAAAAITETQRSGARVVAVGTTTVRTLESAAADGPLVARSGEAALFIRPGHRFQVVDALLTNFHLPRTPLLALVAALAGWQLLRRAYEEAVSARYRFYSFGDAMLIT